MPFVSLQPPTFLRPSKGVDKAISRAKTSKNCLRWCTMRTKNVARHICSLQDSLLVPQTNLRKPCRLKSPRQINTSYLSITYIYFLTGNFLNTWYGIQVWQPKPQSV